jgi:hypothetical protein
LPDGKQASAHFNVNTYATTAWAELQEGEYLVVLPNGGSDGNKARQIGLDCRYLFNQKLNITGVEYASPELTLQIGEKSFVAAEGKWAINETITTANAATKSMWVFTKEYEGEFSTNAYGAAIVLDATGKLIKVYDGANLGFYQGNGKETAHFTTSNYASVAWEELGETETLIIFANDGVNGADSGRTFALGLRTDGSIGKDATLTGFEFASAD